MRGSWGPRGRSGGLRCPGGSTATFDGSSKAVQKILNVKWGQRGHLRVQHPRGARHSVDLMMWPLGWFDGSSVDS